MPSKNTPGKFGKKFVPLNPSLWRRFMRETGVEIEYNTFKRIVNTNTQNIVESIINEPEGVQLPENMGCIVITKYKINANRKKRNLDFVNTLKLGKNVPLLNLHSFGYVYNIRWYKNEVKVKNLKLFSLYKARPLKRGVAKAIKAGANFFQWSASDLWNLTRLERRFNKHYKNEE